MHAYHQRSTCSYTMKGGLIAIGRSDHIKVIGCIASYDRQLVHSSYNTPSHARATATLLLVGELILADELAKISPHVGEFWQMYLSKSVRPDRH